MSATDSRPHGRSGPIAGPGVGRHLLVVDAHGGAAPLPASSHKQALRLAEHLEAELGQLHGHGAAESAEADDEHL